MKFIISTLFFLIITSGGKNYSQTLFFEKNGKKLSGNEIVATIDSINITAIEFFYSYESGPSFSKRNENSKNTYMKYMIYEKLLALDAYNQKLIEKDHAKEMFIDIESDLASEELFKDEILSKVKVTEEEIDTVVNQKQIELELKWLYSINKNEIDEYSKLLNEGVTFDSLFHLQINDSIALDQRQMTISLFDLKKKNPSLAQIIETLPVGNLSSPIHTDDGWYLVKFDNLIQNLITTEAELNKLRNESIEALTKRKMDYLSDQYVNKLFTEENPIIKRGPFNILRSYFGKRVLSEKKYKEWELDKKLENAIYNLGLSGHDKYTRIKLVEGSNKEYSLDEFLNWFWNRELYIKFSKNNLIEFSNSLENLIWRMVRDKMLAREAYEKGYYENDWVKMQSNWWSDKIAYSALRNKLSNTIGLYAELKKKLDTEEINLSNGNDKTEVLQLNEELSKKILYKILELKEKYKVRVNQDIIDKINVSAENDKKAIDMYIIKNGGLIPRPAYPAIDNDWGSWE